MPRRPKGFDPLASLFLKPSSDLAGNEEDESMEEEDSSQLSIFPVLELTDPMFSGPMDHSRPPSTSIYRGQADPVEPAPPVAPPDPRLLAVPEARFFPEDFPEERDPTMETTAVPDPDPPHVPVAEQQTPSRRTIELLPGVEDLEPVPVAPPRPVAPPPAPEPPAADPVALAKALARAAAAKAGPPQPSRVRAKPEKSAAPTTAPARPISRAERLSKRAVRVQSSAEILIREANEVEQEEARLAERRREARAAKQQQQPEPAAVAEPPAFAVQVQKLLEQRLRGLGPLMVTNCVAVEDRNTLRTVWRAHRAHFAASGELERVVGAEAVLDALDRVPAGQLIAAHVHTEASDYMVWLDLRQGLPLAAFAGARAYFVGR